MVRLGILNSATNRPAGNIRPYHSFSQNRRGAAFDTHVTLLAQADDVGRGFDQSTRAGSSMNGEGATDFWAIKKTLAQPAGLQIVLLLDYDAVLLASRCPSRLGRYFRFLRSGVRVAHAVHLEG